LRYTHHNPFEKAIHKAAMNRVRRFKARAEVKLCVIAFLKAQNKNAESS
jgi:hypothetical protein